MGDGCHVLIGSGPQNSRKIGNRPGWLPRLLASSAAAYNQLGRSLVRHLSAAECAIGRLEGEGWHLSNPNLLDRLFTRKEAVLSSRIEGTQTSLRELLATEAGSVVDRSPANLHEVGNYITAFE